MDRYLSQSGAVVFALFCSTAGCLAADEPGIWSSGISRGWLNDHLNASRRKLHAQPRYPLDRMEVWTSGLTKSPGSAFGPDPSDRSVGVKLQPFHDFGLTVGTELTRSGGSRILSSRANWEAVWSREWTRWGGLTFNLSTAGHVSDHLAGYSQSLSGSLGIPLPALEKVWRTELWFTPNVSLDARTGDVGTGLTSEIVGSRVLSAPNDLFESVLNIRVGYGLAPDARPSASARLELTITPNI